MRYGDRRRSRPFDAWDPYRDDPAPRSRNRFEPRRLIRVAVPLLIAGAALGRDLWHIFGPDHSVSTKQTSAEPGVTQVPQEPALTAGRPERPDPRTMLPRSAWPADNPGYWITSDDYPPSALRENLQGNVAFRFTILPSGHVRNCVVTKSSGSALLDETACGIFTLHARYWPARNRAGEPIAGAGTQTVRWQIPKE